MVINEQRQILVVRDKLYQRPHWKLPGGYVDPGERVRPSAVFFSNEFSFICGLRAFHSVKCNFTCLDCSSFCFCSTYHTLVELLTRPI